MVEYYYEHRVQGRQETHNYKNNDVRTSGNSRISMSHETENLYSD